MAMRDHGDRAHPQTAEQDRGRRGATCLDPDGARVRLRVRTMSLAPLDPGLAAPEVSGELMDLYTRVLDLLVAKAPMREVLEAVTTTIDRLMPGASCAVLLLDKTE